MSNQHRLLFIWLVGCVVVLTVTLQMATASFIDGQYLPVGHDAFYHGRRILDAIQSGSLYQFDPRIHVPQGDWITWPWAYDFALAKTVQAVRLVLPADPVKVLVYIPPFLALVGLTLVMAVCVELQLSPGLTLLAVLCFACSAFTAYPFGVGALDHHGAEQLATLGVLWLGLRWFARPDNAVRAALLGLLLGLTLGIHAGLFILQIPVLAAVLGAWWRGQAPPPRAANAFAAGLLAGAIAILLPAATFWQHRFVIYYLSWLHLYVTAATCLVVAFVSRRSFGRSSFALLALLCAVLAAPLLATLAFSREFLSGNLAQIGLIDEIQAPFAIAMGMPGTRRIMQVYTHLIWFAPVTLAIALWMAWRGRSAMLTYFWLAAAFGLALLLAQLRLGSFGAAFLYLPWLLLAQQLVTARPPLRQLVIAATSVALLLAYYPTLRYQLFGGKVPAMDQQYASLRSILPVLRDACAKDPGVVLAEPGEGHLVRYFTECSVISNNFRLTPLDVEKINESLDLIARPLDEVRKRDPRIKYVIARLIAPNESTNPVLFKQLLAVGQPRPPGVEALVELSVTQSDGVVQKFLGAYRLGTVGSP